MRLAEKGARFGLLHSLSITDKPGGYLAFSPNMFRLEISPLGMNPFIHFTCKVPYEANEPSERLSKKVTNMSSALSQHPHREISVSF